MPEIVVDADFPGGNVVVDRIEGDVVTLHQDLRDNSEFWFYWYFRVRHVAGRTVRFVFSRGDVFGALGPCYSPDGRNWLWLGREVLDGLSFTYCFSQDLNRAYFAFGIPYTEANLKAFLASHPQSETSVLATSERGRPVEKLTLPSRQGKQKMVITARHHACEGMASFVLEGLLDFLTGDSPEAHFIREQVDVHVIPFMDKDGVEDGDQGKMRSPHDHWDDYTAAPLYASVRALMDQVGSWRGRFALLLDLHCPAMRDGTNDEIYVVEPEPQWMPEMNRFYGLLERAAQSPLAFDRKNSIAYGVDWNVAGPNCPDYFRNHHQLLAFTLEFAYALAGGVPLSPEKARQFGGQLAAAASRYVEGW